MALESGKIATMHFKIPLINPSLSDAILEKINHKTKPLGALGKLEALALRVALIQQTLSPKLSSPTMLVFAGDHGIAEEGVSPFPQSVTAQMVHNFLQGGAAINVFAMQNAMQLRVVDSGVKHQFERVSGLIDAKIGLGTRNFLVQDAMDIAECELAMTRGAAIMETEIAHGCNVIGFGEMGIGNTSAASCIMAVLCSLPIGDCVGRGTGLNDAGLAHKERVLQQALTFHETKCELAKTNPLQALVTFGGFEIAMMVGAMLRAAEKQCVLLIDGFITTAALLVAAKLQPNILAYCVFSHCSDESGHKMLLNYLEAQPLLQLDLRLGEGTGAALAYPLLSAAVNFLNDMASFASANVSGENNVSV